MAARRMVALTIIDSDAFLDLEASAQSLYFHLNMRADDDGFVNKPNSITRMVGSSKEDLQSLIDQKFLIAFPDGVVVIKHWNVNNSIRQDRYTPTTYQDDKALLELDESGIYHLRKPNDTKPDDSAKPEENHPETSGQPDDNQVTTNPQPDDNQMTPQVRLGKVSLGKYNNPPLSPLAGPATSFAFADNPQAAGYNWDAISKSFTSREMGDAFANWLTIRMQKGKYPDTAVTTAIAAARRAEKEYGAEKCIPLIQKASEGAWTRITWEDLKKKDARAGTTAPKKNVFNNFHQNSYDFDALEKKLLEG